MLKRIKNLFKSKSKSNSKVPFWAQSDFHIALDEYDQDAKDESKKATKEIKAFSKITLDIIEELQKAGHCNSFSFEPTDVRKASMGRIINKHVQRSIFNQQLEDEIDE